MTFELHEDENGFLYLYNRVKGVFCEIEVKGRCHQMSIERMEKLSAVHLATFWERSPDYTVRSKNLGINQVLGRERLK